MEIGDIYYFARCSPYSNTFEVLELKIRTITEKYFVALDSLTEKSSMQAYPFLHNELEDTVFKSYDDAKDCIKEEKARCSK